MEKELLDMIYGCDDPVAALLVAIDIIRFSLILPKEKATPDG